MNTNIAIKKHFCLNLLLLITLSLLALPSIILADDTAPQLSSDQRSFADQINQAFRRAVQMVQPAVVHISVQKKNQPNQVFQFPGGAPTPDGLGSGCIIDKRGYVITNNHVVADTEVVEVILTDGRHFIAQEVLLDPDTDLALVRIDPQGQDLPVAQFGDSDKAQVGDFVLAIGSPFGLTSTVTAGIISYKGRQTHILGKWGYEDFIQTDAVINKGNSGGPLINLYGQIIGINSNIFSLTGQSAGYGFAVPSNLVKFVTDQLIKSKKVKRGYLGVAMISPTLEELRREVPPTVPDRDAIAQFIKKLPKSINGVLVTKVEPDTPAHQAGMKDYDIFLKINGQKMTSSKQLRNFIAQLQPGLTIDCLIWRDGKPIKKQITLADRAVAQQKLAQAKPKEMPHRIPRHWQFPPDLSPDQIPHFGPDQSPKLIPWYHQEQKPKLGITVRPLNENLADQFGYPKKLKGIIIIIVHPDSLAQQNNLQVGDIIVRIDDVPITDTDQLKKIIQNADLQEKGVQMQIRNKKGKKTITVKKQTQEL